MPRRRTLVLAGLAVTALALGLAYRFGMQPGAVFPEPGIEKRAQDAALRLGQDGWLYGYDASGAEQRVLGRDLRLTGPGPCLRRSGDQLAGTRAPRAGEVRYDCLQNVDANGAALRLVFTYRFDPGMRDPAKVTGVHLFGPEAAAVVAQLPAP